MSGGGLRDALLRACKLLATMLAMALCSVALCACTAEGNGAEGDGRYAPPRVDGRFSCNDEMYTFDTVVDTETGVTYLIWANHPVKGNCQVGGITVLVDEYGKPILSERTGREAL